MKAIIFLLAILTVIGCSALFAWIVKLLWNSCLAPATGWREVSFWHAWGIAILVGLLFRTYQSCTKKT